MFRQHKRAMPKTEFAIEFSYSYIDISNPDFETEANTKKFKVTIITQRELVELYENELKNSKTFHNVKPNSLNITLTVNGKINGIEIAAVHLYGFKAFQEYFHTRPLEQDIDTNRKKTRLGVDLRF
jgi:hypothetical protein